MRRRVLFPCFYFGLWTLDFGLSMSSVQMVGTIRPDQPFSGLVGHVDLAVQDLSPVEIPDPDLFRCGFHGINGNRVWGLGSRVWIWNLEPRS